MNGVICFSLYHFFYPTYIWGSLCNEVLKVHQKSNWMVHVHIIKIFLLISTYLTLPYSVFYINSIYQILFDKVLLAIVSTQQYKVFRSISTKEWTRGKTRDTHLPLFSQLDGPKACIWYRKYIGNDCKDHTV